MVRKVFDLSRDMNMLGYINLPVMILHVNYYALERETLLCHLFGQHWVYPWSFPMDTIFP